MTDEQIIAMKANAILTVNFLNMLADRLDSWAEQSKTGGWSTHQVKDNLDAANDCRRQASRLRRVVLL